MYHVAEYLVPEDLYYTADHAWVEALGDGNLKMGLTDFTQKMASTLTFVQLPQVGTATRLEVPIFSYQSAKWVGWIKPAALGRVVEVNSKLTEYPGLANEDPYGKGWAIIIEPSEPVKDALARHLTAQASLEWLEKEIAQYGGR